MTSLLLSVLGVLWNFFFFFFFFCSYKGVQFFAAARRSILEVRIQLDPVVIMNKMIVGVRKHSNGQCLQGVQHVTTDTVCQTDTFHLIRSKRSYVSRKHHKVCVFVCVQY